MAKRIDLCSGCREPLGPARLVVHDPNGPSGAFHLPTPCYPDAIARHRAPTAGAGGQISSVAGGSGPEGTVGAPEAEAIRRAPGAFGEALP